MSRKLDPDLGSDEESDSEEEGQPPMDEDDDEYGEASKSGKRRSLGEGEGNSGKRRRIDREVRAQHSRTTESHHPPETTKTVSRRPRCV